MLTKGAASIWYRSPARQPGDQLRGQRLAEPESEPGQCCQRNRAELRTTAPRDTLKRPPEADAPCAPLPARCDFVTTVASKIRMISYYIDNVTDPRRPRLVRRMNNGDWDNFDNAPGTAVAFDIEGSRSPTTWWTASTIRRSAHGRRGSRRRESEVPDLLLSESDSQDQHHAVGAVAAPRRGTQSSSTTAHHAGQLAQPGVRRSLSVTSRARTRISAMDSSNRSRQAARREEGIALLITLMVLMLVSALMVGFVAAIIADTAPAASIAIRRRPTRPPTPGSSRSRPIWRPSS